MLSQILPKHFRHNKLTSFQRQLNLYGFQRIAKGTEAGRYQHALFDKHRPDKLASIKRESRSSMNGGNDDQGSEDDTEAIVPTIKEPVVSTRGGTRSGRAKKVVAGPEDHTAALAMINISRSLSSECLEDTDTTSIMSSPLRSESPDPSYTTTVKHSEFEHVLQQSLDRQSALEQEVTQLKLLVKTMMSKMENMSNFKSAQNQDMEETFSIEPLASSSASSDDEEEKRPCLEFDDDESFPPAKRLKSQSMTTSLSTFNLAATESPNMTPQLVSPRDGLEQ